MTLSARVFIQDANEDYLESNLVDDTFFNLGINIMIYINSEGDIVYGSVIGYPRTGDEVHDEPFQLAGCF